MGTARCTGRNVGRREADAVSRGTVAENGRTAVGVAEGRKKPAAKNGGVCRRTISGQNRITETGTHDQSSFSRAKKGLEQQVAPNRRYAAAKRQVPAKENQAGGVRQSEVRRQKRDARVLMGPEGRIHEFGDFSTASEADDSRSGTVDGRRRGAYLRTKSTVRNVRRNAFRLDAQPVVFRKAAKASAGRDASSRHKLPDVFGRRVGSRGDSQPRTKTAGAVSGNIEKVWAEKTGVKRPVGAGPGSGAPRVWTEPRRRRVLRYRRAAQATSDNGTGHTTVRSQKSAVRGGQMDSGVLRAGHVNAHGRQPVPAQAESTVRLSRHRRRLSSGLGSTRKAPATLQLPEGAVVSSHSFREMGASVAMAAGYSENRSRRHGLWRRLNTMLEHYVFDWFPFSRFLARVFDFLAPMR
eukprot:SAG31_NODE_988_length_10542_cov_52.848319_2_plen_409_part_00